MFFLLVPDEDLTVGVPEVRVGLGVVLMDAGAVVFPVYGHVNRELPDDFKVR